MVIKRILEFAIKKIPAGISIRNPRRNQKEPGDIMMMKTQEIRSSLFCTLLLGFAAGFVLGAMIVLVMQEVLRLQPAVNVILLASSGWCGILFYFIKLFCLLLPRSRS